MTDLTIALAGNPNVGKSTVFNALTGSRQHVGNWPGKTVERRAGIFKCNGLDLTVVDLPGTYSLSAYSIEEQVARDFIVQEKPAVVVNVLDAANLERNLYLTTQILETGVPVILVLNMHDQAEARGFKFNSQKLSELLGGVPVILAAAGRGYGLESIKQAIADFFASRPLFSGNGHHQPSQETVFIDRHRHR